MLHLLSTASQSLVNWQAVAALAAVAALVGGWVGKKVDRVGEHLEKQDDALAALGQRVARLEGYERLNRQDGLDRLTERRRVAGEQDG